MHKKNELKKFLSMVLKRFCKYFFIIVVFIMMSIPLVLTSYNLAKETIIKNNTIRINEGIKKLDSQIKRNIEIANIIKMEDSYKKLTVVRNLPRNDQYTYISELKEKLSQLTLTQELVVESHLLFRKNPIFISNYISTDNYESIYPSFINYESIPVERWYKDSFEANSKIIIKPTSKYYSKYYSPDYFDALTISINNDQTSLYKNDVSFSAIYNKKDIVNTMIFQADMDQNIFFMVDKQNNVILSNNFDEKKGLDNIQPLDTVTINSKKYKMIKSDNIDFGLTAFVGIPVKTFEDNIYALIKVVFFSNILAIVVAIILSFIFSMKETISLKKIIDLIDKSATLKIKTKNEYKYLDYAITQLDLDNKYKLYQIKSLDKLIKSRMLESMFNHGIYTEVEEHEALDCFGNSFEYFCVAVIRMEEKMVDADVVLKSINTIYQNTLQEIETLIKSVMKDNEFFGVITNLHEYGLVILLNDTDQTDLQYIKECFVQLIDILNIESKNTLSLNIGISRICYGITNIREGYLQSRDVLNYNDISYNSKVSIYETPRNIYHKKTMDYAVLNNCYDSILIGDKKTVEKIFDGIIKTISTHDNEEREKQQLFYAIRQPLYNAFLEITKEQTTMDNFLKLPNFNGNISLIDLVVTLKESSLELCHFQETNKNSDKEMMKQKLMNYIEENYADVNLSAYMIATNMGLSEKYIFSVVKENTNTTLSKLIEDVRILKTEQLLLTTDYSNSKIASLCGFGSTNTFYRAFSKKHLVTPNVFKKNNYFK